MKDKKDKKEKTKTKEKKKSGLKKVSSDSKRLSEGAFDFKGFDVE